MYSRDKLLHDIELLAEGIDPLTKKEVPSDTILNRPDIIRMFYSMRDYINLTTPLKVSKNDVPFRLSSIDNIIEEKTTVSKLARAINDNNCFGNMKKLSYKAINAWLIKEGYLFVSPDNKKVPTSKGIEAGITRVLKHKDNGVYYVVEFNENIQQIILHNLAEGNINPDETTVDIGE